MTRPLRLTLGAGLLLLVVLAVVTARALTLASRQPRTSKITAISVDRSAAAGRLAAALRLRTISTDRAGRDDSEFLALHALLEREFPLAHRALSKEIVNGYSLLYTWEGRGPALPPLVFAAHLDVVPVEDAMLPSWTHPPFEGRIVEGTVWGRGAIDDKASLLGLLEAVELLVASSYEPERTIHLAFGHDEERGGTAGASSIARRLAARGKPAEMVLDEGGFIIARAFPGVDPPVALIGVAEKGHVSLELTAGSTGGHSSAPPSETAVGVLSTAIHRLQQAPMPAAIRDPTRSLFEHLAPEMRLPYRVMFANLGLFAPLVRAQLERVPATNAMVRTTFAPTMFEGSPGENVLPAQARAVVNVRILPGDSVAIVVDHATRTIDDPRVAIRPLGSPAEPSAVSNIDGPAFQTLRRVIHGVFPDAISAPYLVIGATDARHYATISPNVYRFLPLRHTAEVTSLMHGVNERLPVEAYVDMVRFYAALMQEMTR